MRSYSYTSKARINDAERALLSNPNVAPFIDYAKLKKVYADRNIANARIGYSFPGDHVTSRCSVTISWATRYRAR